MANPTDDSSWKWYGDPAASGAVNSPVMAGRPPIRAVVFDAGHTLLEMDYARLTAYLVSRGHALGEARVTEAERRARMRLDVERAAQSSRVRTGEGRYVRYLVEYLGIVDDVERTAIAEWRRGFNAPIGLCHQADGEAAKALQHARDMGLVVGVISNSNGSVQRALDIAGLAVHLEFVIDSSVVGITKPDPRIFELGARAARATPEEIAYIGDSYFVDVVGARRAGLGAVLFDPGRVWGARDCAVATGLCAAVEQALGQSARRARAETSSRGERDEAKH
jgi:putative hydrolase of the HAD superfamily